MSCILFYFFLLSPPDLYMNDLYWIIPINFNPCSLDYLDPPHYSVIVFKDGAELQLINARAHNSWVFNNYDNGGRPLINKTLQNWPRYLKSYEFILFLKIHLPESMFCHSETRIAGPSKGRNSQSIKLCLKLSYST